MATPIIMPRLGDFMTEGQVGKWAKSPGESVKQGEVIAEIESEKLNYDLEAASDGVLHTIVSEGDTVLVDGIMGYLLAEGEAPPETITIGSGVQVSGVGKITPQTSTSIPQTLNPNLQTPSTPGARRLAASLGIDISQVTPTGPRGRVVDADVRAHAEQQGTSQKGPKIPPGLPTTSKIVPLEGIRKAVAEHMRGSIANTAQLSYFLEVDVTEAQRLRREISRESNSTLTLANVLTMACAETLKRVPAHNTILSDGSILYFDEINIGVAVALDDGLIVPVIRNVQDKDIFQVSKETQELAEKAREGKLLPDEVIGGTFTISVLGTVDGFTPILNPGQSAILGVGRPSQKPVVKDGEIVIREMMTVSLTADHQVIDGAVAASFMRRFQQQIERPSALFKKG